MRTSVYGSGNTEKLTVRLSPEVTVWLKERKTAKAVELAFRDLVPDERAVPKPVVEHVKGAVGRPRKFKEEA